MAAQREDTSCPAGYFHYTCNFNGHSYAGCCRVDACKQNPVGCPLAAQPRISTTKTSTSLESSSSLSSSPAPTTLETPTFLSSAGATFPAATAVSSADGNSNHGILIPLGGLIALVVIPAVVAVAGAILAWQRWCKRRDSKAEDGAIAAPDLPAMYQAPKSTPVPLPDHQEVPGVANDPSWASVLARESHSQQSIFEYRGVSGASPYRDSTHTPVSPTVPSTPPALHSVSPHPLSLSQASPPQHLSPALSELDSTPVHREMNPITTGRARAMELERMTPSSVERCAELAYDEDARATGGSPGRGKDPDVYPNRWPRYGAS